MSNTTKLRLIGAKSFVSRPRGIFNPVYAGDVVEVDNEHVPALLEQEYRVGKHSRFKLFSKDVNAEVVLKDVEPMPMEARRELEADRRKESEAVEQATARAEAAEQRAAEFEQRMQALEAKLLGSAQEAPAAIEKKAPRKRPAKKAAA